MLSVACRASPRGACVAAPILLEAYGRDRVLWGCDRPHTITALDCTTTYPKMLQSLAEWVSRRGRPPQDLTAPVGRIRRQAAEPSKLFSIGSGPSIRLRNRESPRASRDILIVIVTSVLVAVRRCILF